MSPPVPFPVRRKDRWFLVPIWRWTEVFGWRYVCDEIELGFRVAQWFAEEDA